MKDFYRKAFSIRSFIWMLGSFIISVFEAVYPLVYAEWMRRVISEVQFGVALNGRLLIMGLMLLVIQLGLIWGCNLYNIIHGKLFMVRLREVFFEKLNSISPEYFTDYSVGEMITLYRADLADISKFYTMDVQRFVQIAISFVSAIFYFSAINPIFIPACVIPTLVCFFLLVRVRRQQLTVRKEAAKASDQLASFYEDVALGYGDIKQNAAEPSFLQKGEAYFTWNMQADQKVRKYDQLVFTLSVLSHSLSSVLILVSGIFCARQGLIDVGAVVAAYNIFYLIANPIRNFSRNLACIQRLRVAVERVGKLFGLPDEPAIGQPKTDVSSCSLLVSLVSYTYPSGFTLQPVNFAVKRGEHIVIVGQSGCGKSTLAKLLLGYSENYCGRIVWFGQELKEWTLRELRARVRYVANDLWIPELTVREYLLCEEGNGCRMEEVLRAVELWDELQGQTEHMDACLKNNAANLSSGQRQRLLLARAILDGGDVFVLDEMFSAMDMMQAGRILKKLRMYCSTVIQITHLTAFARGADRVLLLSPDKPAILGSHDRLIHTYENYRGLISDGVKKEGEAC